MYWECLLNHPYPKTLNALAAGDTETVVSV